MTAPASWEPAIEWVNEDGAETGPATCREARSLLKIEEDLQDAVRKSQEEGDSSDSDSPRMQNGDLFSSTCARNDSTSHS